MSLQDEEAKKMLFVSESEMYGNKYIEHLLEQYKIYIESSEKISDRRQRSNEFFSGLNTVLVGLLGVASSQFADNNIDALIISASIAGITMCYFWYRIIRAYKGLNGGKFRILHWIEERLPMAIYDTEWEALGRGENKQIYWPVTHIEEMVPWVFIAIYGILLFSTLPLGLISNICIIYAWF